MGPLTSERILHSNAILLFCLAAFIPVHFFGINHHGFWGDETITASVSLMPLKELIANRLQAGHFPPYFILIKYWGEIFGTSEASLRFPSLLFMTTAFGGIWLFSRRYLAATPAAALLFLLLFFFNPTVFRLSQEARMYGPLVCTTIFSSYFFLVFLEKGDSRPLIACLTFLILSLVIHAQAFLLLAIQLLFLLLLHRRKLFKYLGGLFLPLLIFLVVWKTGSSDYNVAHLPPSFKPLAVITVLARAGMFAAGETDAYLFRTPPWSDLVFPANIIFLFFLASCLQWFFGKNRPAAEIDEKTRLQTSALSYLFFLLVLYFAVMVVLGVLDIRAAHRVRYFITAFPYIFIVVAVGAVHLPDFLERAWYALQFFSWCQTSSDAHIKTLSSGQIVFIASRIIAGSLMLVYAFLYAQALHMQLNWKGPGYKEAILQLKENYREGEPVITCCMPNMQYGFNYYGADHIQRRLHLPRRKSISYTSVRIKKITGDSDRVWFLFYRNIPEQTDPVLQSFEEAYKDYSIFFDQKYPVARLLGYEKKKIPYDPDDPLGLKHLIQREENR